MILINLLFVQLRRVARLEHAHSADIVSVALMTNVKALLQLEVELTADIACWFFVLASILGRIASTQSESMTLWASSIENLIVDTKSLFKTMKLFSA